MQSEGIKRRAGVGVCRDTSPKRNGMRGSRDDGGRGGVCPVVIA